MTAETTGVVRDPAAVDDDPAAEVADEGTPFLAPAIPGEPAREEAPASAGSSAPAKATLPAVFRTGGTIATATPGADQVQAVLGAVLERFDLDAAMAGYHRGPTTTCHFIEPGPKVLVSAVTKLGPNFANATGCEDLEMLSVISGRPGLIGVVVPNAQNERVAVLLGDILASEAGQAMALRALVAALGLAATGRPVLIDLAKLPHILIAGATGSGKTSVEHAIITTVVSRATPADVKMILIDTKRVELAIYAGLPHLLVPIITDPVKAAEALDWAVGEMDRRYELLARYGFRHIDDFNDAARNGLLTGDDGALLEPWAYLLVVVDEFSDLMKKSAKLAKQTEDSVVRFTQLARAAGGHLVLATQRPEVAVVTGLIKANMPCRLAGRVTSNADSRVILDQGGAEKLLGAGDFLLLTQDATAPERLQVAYVTEKEIRAVVDQAKELYPAPDSPAVTSPAAGEDSAAADGEDPALLAEAARLVITTQFGSVSMLQRKLRVGYPKAGALMDELEKRGIVGPADGSKARAVLVSAEDANDPEGVLASLATETAGV